MARWCQKGMVFIMEKAVFLDRDGTINVEKRYLYKPEDFEFIDGASEAIKQLNQLGYKVIVISNQSGIARGFYTITDVSKLHNHIDHELKKHGARIDAYYFCPHHPDYGPKCNCRKPETGLIEKAVQDFYIDLTESWMVGDKASDIECAARAKIRAALVMTGYAGQGIKYDSVIAFKDLLHFVESWLR